MMSANSQIRFDLKIVFVYLYITPSHYHHCARLSEDIELIECLSDIVCRVCKIRHIISVIPYKTRGAVCFRRRLWGRPIVSYISMLAASISWGVLHIQTQLLMELSLWPFSAPFPVLQPVSRCTAMRLVQLTPDGIGSLFCTMFKHVFVYIFECSPQQNRPIDFPYWQSSNWSAPSTNT